MVRGMRSLLLVPLALSIALSIAFVPACGGSDGGGESADAAPGVDAVIPCTGQPGEAHAQSLSVDGEDRFYWLYVPTTYTCDEAWPLLIDFHGTSGGAEPEISYKTPELMALADAERFIVARPRSRSSSEGGEQIFRWDQNPGDLARNEAFARGLVNDLRGRYHVDPARTYASGFSSGTNMAAQFLDDDGPFVGFGMVAGGYWNAPTGLHGAPRVYDVTGWRDYLYNTAVDLETMLVDAGLPEANFYFRHTDSGHELYGWHFAEMWAFLDRGERPAAGTPTGAWSREDDAPLIGLTEIARGAGGVVIAATSDGGLERRAADGTWSTVAPASALPLTGVCLFASGNGVAVGAQRTLVTDDGGASWTEHAAIRGASGFGLDPAYLNGVACGGDGRAVAAGYWDAFASDDEGVTWEVTSLDSGFDYPSQASAVIADDLGSGALLATGYFDFVAVAAPGGALVPSNDHPLSLEWWNGGALRGSLGLLVGETGAIMRSEDGGASWTHIISPTTNDLYAVALRGSLVGLAVGAHGAALLTTDGGWTWTEAPTGITGTLAGVAWVDATTAVAVGDGGALLFSMPGLAEIGD